MKKLILLSCILVAIFISCSKTENPPSVYLDYTKHNLAGKYKVTGLTFKTNDSNIEYDILSLDSLYKTCRRDDILVFDTNNVFTVVDSSGLICDSTNLTYVNQYTIYNNNQLAGVRTYEADKTQYYPYIMQSLTANTLVLSKSETVPTPLKNIFGQMKVTLTRIP